MNEGIRKEEIERDGVPYTLPYSADVSVSTAGYCNGAIASDGSLGEVRWCSGLATSGDAERRGEGGGPLSDGGGSRKRVFDMLRHGVQSMCLHMLHSDWLIHIAERNGIGSSAKFSSSPYTTLCLHPVNLA
jgi:hypothetical protein